MTLYDIEELGTSWVNVTAAIAPSEKRPPNGFYVALKTEGRRSVFRGLLHAVDHYHLDHRFHRFEP
jgi:hypothetical protein